MQSLNRWASMCNKPGRFDLMLHKLARYEIDHKVRSPINIQSQDDLIIHADHLETE